MNLYQLGAECEKYSWIMLEPEGQWTGLLDHFAGQNMADAWTPVTIALIRERSFRRESIGDFPTLNGAIPVFSARAADSLGDILARHGELLPTRGLSPTYYLYNTTTFVDALDEERSDIRRYQSGRVMHLKTVVFGRDRLLWPSVFKLPQMPKGHTYVTDEFVDRVRGADLKGFKFLPVG